MDDQIRDNLVTSYISKSRKNNVFLPLSAELDLQSTKWNKVCRRLS